MSVSEDTELRDLVSQVLEKNGTLSKIRAELRASVFLALEDQPSENKSHFTNNALKEYLTTKDSALSFCLVREFLEYLQLDNTLAVFNTETHHGQDYDYKGREALIEDLNFQIFKDKPCPLLSVIIQIAKGSLGFSSDPFSCEEQNRGDFLTNSMSSPKLHMPSNISYTETSNASLDNSHKLHNQTYTTGTLVTSFGSPESSLEKQTVATDGLSSKLKTETTAVKQQPKSDGSMGDNQNVTKGLSDMGDIKTSPNKDMFAHSRYNNPQTSLSNLPPLQELKAGTNHGNLQKTLYSSLIPDDHYEEDFSSESSSGGDSKETSQREQEKKDESKPDKTSTKDLNSPVASVSEELEGDGNSATDEVNSAASADTLDSSLSNLDAKIADHMEQF